jgi:hypothetical protein
LGIRRVQWRGLVLREQSNAQNPETRAPL